MVVGVGGSIRGRGLWVGKKLRVDLRIREKSLVVSLTLGGQKLLLT